MCVRVRAAKHRSDVKWMFKDIVEMKRWDVKRYNTWKFVTISLIHAKRNLHENEYPDSRYILHLVRSSSFLILWNFNRTAVSCNLWWRMDASWYFQGVFLSTKGSKLAHWEQWVVLKKKVNIYAVVMKIRLDRIPQATKSKQWKYALDAVCSRQTTHFPGTNIISLSWLYLWALRLFLRIQYIGWRTKIPHAKMINRSEFLINIDLVF